MKDIVFYFACKYFGDWERIFDALEEQKDVDFEELEILKEEHKGKYVTVYDPRYPVELRHTDKPPFVLWYKGDLDLLSRRNKYWVFGSYYDIETNEYLKNELPNFAKFDLTPISGYSSEFERQMINNNPPKDMIIVKDSGINSSINMTAIEEQTLIVNNVIVSEYPYDVIPSLHTWMRSNVVKTGMSKRVFVVNTNNESLTYKVISTVVDETKDIYCYAGNKMKKSKNRKLISMGAYAINNIKEINN